MYTVYKKFEFASAHQLEGHAKCGFLHGHNYIIEATISSNALEDEFGFVFDFGKFKEIQKKYDHTGNIINISSEALAKQIAIEVTASAKVKIEHIKIRVWESDHSYAQFQGSPKYLKPDDLHSVNF